MYNKTLILCLLSLFLFNSCSPEQGSIGPIGPAGEKGIMSPDALSVISFQNGLNYHGTTDTNITSCTTCSLSWGTIMVGSYHEYIARGILKFDLSSLPANHTEVAKATLTLYITDTTSSIVYLKAHPSTREWNTSASWDGSGEGSPWLGGEYIITPMSDTLQILSAGYVTLTLNKEIVQAWVDNPEYNYGLFLTGSHSDDSSNYVQIQSSDYGDTFKKYLQNPKLILYLSPK